MSLLSVGERAMSGPPSIDGQFIRRPPTLRTWRHVYCFLLPQDHTMLEWRVEKKKWLRNLTSRCSISQGAARDGTCTSPGAMPRGASREASALTSTST